MESICVGEQNICIRAIGVLAPSALEIADDDVWDWVETLFEHIRAQEVITLCTLKSLTYDSDLHDACALYMLTSSRLDDDRRNVRRGNVGFHYPRL